MKKILASSISWRTLRLGDLERKGGGTPDTSNPDYWNGDINWITSKNIDDDGNITYEKKITEPGLRNSSTNLIPKQSVIMVTRVGLGKVAINEKDTAINQDCQAFICDESVNPKYLKYRLLEIADEIKFKGQGTTISGITVSKLNSILISIPKNRKDQDAIVEAVEKGLSVVENLEGTIQSLTKKARLLRISTLRNGLNGQLTNGD